jgi:hypothetical protein
MTDCNPDASDRSTRGVGVGDRSVVRVEAPPAQASRGFRGVLAVKEGVMQALCCRSQRMRGAPGHAEADRHAARRIIVTGIRAPGGPRRRWQVGRPRKVHGSRRSTFSRRSAFVVAATYVPREDAPLAHRDLRSARRAADGPKGTMTDPMLEELADLATSSPADSLD